MDFMYVTLFMPLLFECSWIKHMNSINHMQTHWVTHRRLCFLCIRRLDAFCTFTDNNCIIVVHWRLIPSRTSLTLREMSCAFHALYLLIAFQVRILPVSPSLEARRHIFLCFGLLWHINCFVVFVWNHFCYLMDLRAYTIFTICA